MGKKQRILFIGLLDGGGAEKVLSSILQHFDYNKYEVTVLSSIDKQPKCNEVPDEVIKKIIFNGNFFILVINILKHYKLFKLSDAIYRHFILRGIGNAKFDTIVSFTEGPNAKIHSLIMDKGKRHVSWVHCDFVKFPWSHKFFNNDADERKFYSSVDEVVFVSKDALNSWKSIYGSSKKETVLYNLVDREKICEMADNKVNIEKYRFTICSVGRLISVKRIDRLINAVKILKEGHIDIDLWIIGSGDCEAELKGLVERQGLKENIHFWGFQANPYKFMKLCDVLVLSSDSEGYPMVVCEALSLGLPVIATRITGPKEILADNVGILCDLDERKIADAIRELYIDEELRAQYTSHSLEYSHSFDCNIVMNKVYSIIKL